jgi:hypothetical protein
VTNITITYQATIEAKSADNSALLDEVAALQDEVTALQDVLQKAETIDCQPVSSVTTLRARQFETSQHPAAGGSISKRHQ